jgi:hypothetical protein
MFSDSSDAQNLIYEIMSQVLSLGGFWQVIETRWMTAADDGSAGQP